MAEPKGGLAFIPETSPESIQANKAYQDALNRLNSALEARQNRMFDPTMLALAEGFLTPGRTGSFGESLGVAAGKMRAAEEEEGKTEMALAQAKLGLAERGIALEQQRQRERQFREALEGAPGGVSAGAPAGVPSGGQAGAETTQRPEDRLAQAVSDTPPAVQGMVGIQVFPPTQNLVTSRSLLMQRYREGRMSLGDALAEAAKLENDRYVFRDNSVLDKLTGRMFFSPTGGTQRIMTSKGPMELPTDLIRLGRPELIEQYIKNLPSTAEVAGREAGARASAERGQSPNQIKINLPRADGTYGSYEIPAQAAFELGRLITQHGINSPEVLRYASKFTGESVGPAPSAAPAGLPGAAPAAAPAAPPVSGAAGRVPSESERAVTEASRRQFAETLAKSAAEKEANLPQAEMSAREMSSLVNRVLGNLSTSGEFVGLLSRPGIGPAVLKLLSEGIQTREGSYRLTGAQEALLRVSGATKQDIQNIEKIGGDLSQAELLFTQLYLKGQGAITEGERRIVRQLGSTTEQSAEAIRTRMALLKERSEFDKESIIVYREWKQKNPDKSFADFQTTPQFGKLLSGYESRTAGLADQNLIERGRTYQFGGKRYEYIGPDNDPKAARVRSNYREVQ
jgi:hypothetical protein